jgi:hypothetical protein
MLHFAAVGDRSFDLFIKDKATEMLSGGQS